MNKKEHDELIAKIYEESKDFLRDLRSMQDLIKDPRKLFEKYKINFYDRMGNPIDYPQFNILQRYAEYTIVKQEHIGDFYISTIWLGVGYNLESNGIFETMSFLNDEVVDEITSRYATEKAAIIGHKKAVEYCKKLKS